MLILTVVDPFKLGSSELPTVKILFCILLKIKLKICELVSRTLLLQNYYKSKNKLNIILIY